MGFRIRKARLKDISYIRDLSIDSVVWGIPETRDVSPEFVRSRARESLRSLELGLLSATFVILLAEDVTEDEQGQVVEAKRVGYIMLDLAHVESSTGEPQCMIVDLAVQRSYWGRWVVNHLVKAAAELTAEHGLKYLVGEVTASNKRTLGTALKGLHFEVERYQIMRRVQPATAPPGTTPS
jgi:GNAT superfamily N-acetyltransferase